MAEAIYRWDIHTHTIYSNRFYHDSDMTPVQLIAAARKARLDGVVVAEHLSFEYSAPIEEIARREGFPVLRAAEYSSDIGHLLLYGVTDDSFNRHRYRPAKDVIAEVNALGGAVVVSHPFHSYGRGPTGLYLGSPELEGVVALETLSANTDLPPDANKRAQKAAGELGLPQTGSSDAHCPRYVGRYVTEFSRPITSISDLVAALREGKYQPAENPYWRP